MTRDELLELEERGWRITRDGSTATAQWAWDDPEEPENGWEVLVLHTSGHRPRFTLNLFEGGLTERYPADLERLQVVMGQTQLLLDRWQGELAEE